MLSKDITKTITNSVLMVIELNLRSVSGKAHDFSRGMKANDATNINIIIHIPKTKST